jgi:enamine deaminase RidA (YjgF/YER057c/UK114 family)
MTRHDPALSPTAGLRANVALPLGQAVAMPKSVDTLAEFAALEQRHIFARGRFCAGGTDALRAPGDCLTMEIPGEPILVLRDRNGHVPAMSKVCRHRISTLAEGCGTTRAIIRPRPARNCSPPDPERPPMAHTRIRKFNTRDTYPEQKLDNDLCQAVVARGTMIFLRGQCPQDLDTARNIDSHDPVEQTHKVMQNIRQLIEESGGRMEHLCKVVVYLTDVRHREAVYRTMGEYIKGVHPVSTGVVVTALARPEWLVEIDATAMIPD